VRIRLTLLCDQRSARRHAVDSAGIKSSEQHEGGGCVEFENTSTSQLIAEVQQLRQRVAELEQRAGGAAGLAPDREHLFQSMLDSCPVTLYAKDLDGRYILANQKTAEQIGRPRQAILGLTNYDLFPPEVAAGLEAIDQQIIATHELVEREAEVVIDGQPTTQLVIKFPLLDPQGAIYAIGGVATDITGRKRAVDGLGALLPAAVRGQPAADLDHRRRQRAAGGGQHRRDPALWLQPRRVPGHAPARPAPGR
jgi:PAS domain S-box-containing protein